MKELIIIRWNYYKLMCDIIILSSVSNNLLIVNLRLYIKLSIIFNHPNCQCYSCKASTVHSPLFFHGTIRIERLSTWAAILISCPSS